MYHCELCQRLVPPHTPATLVVLQTRRVHYPDRQNANRAPNKRSGKRKAYFVPHDPHHDPRDDPGGHGYEIVKEARACPDCAAAYLNGRHSAIPLHRRE
jgi:hypothetical protein